MTTYAQPEKPTTTIANRVLKKYHTALVKAGVVLDLLMAHADTNEEGQATGDAITRDGVRVGGVASIVGPKHRAQGLGDALLLLDGDAWETMKEAEQEALIDHLLARIELKSDREGAVLTDDENRPKLKLRPWGYVMKGYREVAKRHGAASVEEKAACDFQLSFDWEATTEAA